MCKQNHATRKQKTYAYFLLFVFMTTGILLFIYGFGEYSVRHDNVKSTPNAVFDCSEARPFEKVHRYYLEGHWQFFYRQWIISDKPENAVPTAQTEIPGSRTDNLITHPPYENGGYASYRCYVEGLHTDSAVMIYIPNLACAYRIYADGKLVTESGTTSKIQGETKSSTSSIKEPILLDETLHEIVIEVSANTFSGLYLSPMIADYAHENAYVNGMLALRYSLIGIILYAAVILFIIKFITPIRIFSPWLPILFALISLRMLFSTEGYSVSQSWVFSMSYEKMHILTFASPFIMKLTALMYYRDELKLYVPKRTVACMGSFFAVIVAAAYLFPQIIFNNSYYWILQLFSSVADVYIIRKLCGGLAAGKKSAGILCGAYLFLLCGIDINILYTGGVMSIRSSAFMPLSLALFALFVTIMHARNAVLLYQRAQQTSRLERELEKANMAVMISQIQPHFLYNALNTIKSLIRRNPKAAEEAVIDFSYYLRGNMDSLSHTEPIPFRTELDHIRHYCKIELLRFSDKLHIEYDIKTDDFSVPTLSIQPLVENAIKHGVTKRPEGGTVQIHTCEDDKNYIVCVKDNGIGFDPTDILKKDGRSHVGLPNIQYRFATMLHAEVDVQSTPDVGTAVTVRIPKDFEKEIKNIS